MSVTNGDLLKVDLRYTVSGIGVSCNVFQCQVYQASPHALEDSYVLASMADWMTRIYEPMLPHIVTTFTDPIDYVYKKIDDQWNFMGGNTLTDMDGESTGDPLPSAVALLMQVGTGTSRGVGKKYLGGLSETAVTAGLWVAGVVAAATDSCVEWMSQFQDLDDTTTWFVPGVYSTKALAFKAFVSSYELGNIPAYQRRRKPLVGA